MVVFLAVKTHTTTTLPPAPHRMVLQPKKLIFGMQPSFDPTKKTSIVENGRQPYFFLQTEDTFNILVNG
jgi:hypothetical protein